MQTIGSSDQGVDDVAEQVLLSKFESECIEFFVQVVQVIGVQKSIGQIYGLIFASKAPLAFTDIVDRLKISKGSVSQGLQFLRSLGAIKAGNTKLDRREVFTPELGLRSLVSALLRDRVEPILREGEMRMKQIRESAQRDPDAASRNFSIRRAGQIDTWRRQLWLLLPIFKTLTAPPRR